VAAVERRSAGRADARRVLVAQVAPDEPVVHIYAEGKTKEDSVALEAELHALVEEIMQTEEAATR